jgi:hypothetical protein
VLGAGVVVVAAVGPTAVLGTVAFMSQSAPSSHIS